MNIGHAILSGFAATVVLTTAIVSARALHFTRMDIPFLLGTIWTNDRDKAKWSGFIMHLVLGWIFAFIYIFFFEMTGLTNWWFGALIGVAHGAFVLTAGMGLVQSFHPRMATEERGPEPTRMLEPPGFFILNYGSGTPMVSIIAHMLYGGVLGFLYSN